MPLRIAMTGSTGFVGSFLLSAFQKKGINVIPIIRSSTPVRTNRLVIRWNIEFQKIEADKLEGHDVVIHLGGANIADKRWTDSYKKIIFESRKKGTTFLASTLAQLKNPPKLFISMSAIGFYGNDSLSIKKDETSPKGLGFLADVCEAWESATAPARLKGIRVVCARMGVVLGQGGALLKMLPIFKSGLGGKLGSGEQPMSWVALEEIPLMIQHVIENKKLSGPVNFVSPQAVSNEEFTKNLGEVLRRPIFFSVPDFAVRFMFGEMADALLLGGQNVVPNKFLESGYVFQFAELKKTLENTLNKH